jgi:molybdopterin-guanine dinucleotide biosynthesis protein A
VSEAGVSGIVLAGGASTRFGSDKLAARVGGGTLLDLAVAAISQAASEVLVIVAPGDGRALPQAQVPVRRVEDPERHGGPLIGLLAGLEAAAEPIVLVVGGDMPALLPTVLRALVRALEASGGSADAAVLRQRSVARPLPVVLRNGAATPAARRLIAEGERSLRALVAALVTRELAENEWRGLDPEAVTLTDVDRPQDLPRTPRT